MMETRKEGRGLYFARSGTSEMSECPARGARERQRTVSARREWVWLQDKRSAPQPANSPPRAIAALTHRKTVNERQTKGQMPRAYLDSKLEVQRLQRGHAAPRVDHRSDQSLGLEGAAEKES